jgi:hypothetical protein
VPETERPITEQFALCVSKETVLEEANYKVFKTKGKPSSTLTIPARPVLEVDTKLEPETSAAAARPQPHSTKDNTLFLSLLDPAACYAKDTDIKPELKTIVSSVTQ